MVKEDEGNKTVNEVHSLVNPLNNGVLCVYIIHLSCVKVGFYGLV